MYMPMIPDAIEHAAPTRNAMPVRQPRSSPKILVSATSLPLEDRDDDADDDRADDGEDADRRVLAPDEGDRALEDRAGDVLHRLGARVTRQDVAGEVQGEQHGDDAGGRMISWSVLASIGLGWSSRLSSRGTDAGGQGVARAWRSGKRAVLDRLCSAGASAHAPIQPVRAGPESSTAPRPYTPAPVSQRPALGCLFEVVETLVLTVVIFLGIQTFVAQPYKVQQGSMENTLLPDQYVLVDKLTPRWAAYARGDIVVFDPPETWSAGGGVPFIKRVIGLPGRPGRAPRRQGLRERHRSSTSRTSSSTTASPRPPTRRPAAPSEWLVPTGDLLVMGDHRQDSADSRSFGPIEIKHVIGRAWLRYWPFDTFGILPTPGHPELPTVLAGAVAGISSEPEPSSSP